MVELIWLIVAYYNCQKHSNQGMNQMVRKAEGNVKCAILMLQYHHICFMYSLPIGWNSPSLEFRPSVHSFRHVLWCYPVNIKHITIAVCC
jgi:hypothetical protein